MRVLPCVCVCSGLTSRTRMQLTLGGTVELFSAYRGHDITFTRHEMYTKSMFDRGIQSMPTTSCKPLLVCLRVRVLE